jgi:RNA polymerase sigma-70 factor (ECF subfamily)
MSQLEHIDIERLKRGDPHEFSLLIDLHAEKVYNLLRRLLRDETEAEDLTQEVFTTVFLTISQFKGDAKLSTWIYRITVNKFKEHVRNRSRKKRFGFLFSLDSVNASESLTSNAPNPQGELENKERSEIVIAAINQLPEKQFLAFTMHKIEGVSQQEIGTILNLSISAVESLIFRARKSLQQKLQGYYLENEM